MRHFASFLLIMLALPVAAADTWRWKDENGVVHYSDQPAPGAVRVQVGKPAKPDYTAATGQSASPPPQAEPAAQKFKYSECIVLAPGNDQVFNAVDTVTAALKISPSMLAEHHLLVVFDTRPYPGWPDRMLTWKLTELNRGTHTLAVVVLDARNQPVCEGPAITFHVRQPSILAPARKPKEKQP